MPKIIAAVVVILLIAYVVTYPTESANLVHAGWGHTKNIVHSLGDFVHKVAS